MEYETRQGPITAFCTALVNGVGQVDVETDYLPHVVQCENGGAPLEALKAQAVSARTFLYYKLETSGSINDGTSDQVYSCGANPLPQHYQAVEETAGMVLTYSSVPICAFYVAGAIPSGSDCVATSSDSDPTSTERYVTYNWNLSGSNIEQTTLGWVDPGNIYNRGCKSQNGARCLANKGWSYPDILNFYYGMDIGLEQAVGSCVQTQECTPGQEESRACTMCGVELRVCDSSGSWGAWSACQDQGVCTPGDQESGACGDCGLWHRTCEADCTWGPWSACEEEADGSPCDTGATGICGEGVLVCRDGEVVCEPASQGEPELCDGLDNDCNGEVDDGLPPVLGDPPPALAAQLAVIQAPSQVAVGEPADVRLRATNLGSQPWAAGEVVIQAAGDGSGAPSQLYTAGEWLSEDVPVVLDAPLDPGQELEVNLPITVPSETSTSIQESFWLATAEGARILCPEPVVEITVSPDLRLDVTRPDAGPGVEPSSLVTGGCGCRAWAGAPGAGSGIPVGLPLLAALILGMIGIRRRRR